jgi:replicative DNA helicase
MTEQIDLVAVLKQQREQLEHLIRAKIWIGDTPKATVEEMREQVARIKSLIQVLDGLIEGRR